MTFNLLEEPWIPILWSDGQSGCIGARRALVEARQIRQVAISSPLDRFAIFRFLLAVLYWCEGNPPAGSSMPSKTLLTKAGLAKLDGNAELFDLFGDRKRFYQFIAPDGAKPLSVSYLLHEFPTGINIAHFRHSRDGVGGLCRACCAMGLVRLPVFTTMGGQRKGPGINRTPPIYAIPIGDALLDTLKLSWTPVQDLGTPSWEEPGARLPERGIVPLLMGLTWLPRRVWLESPTGPARPCLYCGQVEEVVFQCAFGGRGKTSTKELPWRDPHTLPRGGWTNGHGPLTAKNAAKPGAVDAGARQWQDVVRGVTDSDTPHPSTWWVVAFATDQNKYIETVEWTVEMGASHSREPLASLKQEERNWEEKALLAKLFPKDLFPTDYEHLRERQKERLGSMILSTRPQLEEDLRASFATGDYLGDGQWAQPGDADQRALRLIASSLFPGHTVSAVGIRMRLEGAFSPPAPRGQTRRSPSKGTRSAS